MVWCCQNATLSSVHTTTRYNLPLILYRTHTWLNITVAKSQQFPTAITQKVLPPWAATAEPRNVGRQGTVFRYNPAHFLTMCPFSSSIIINYFTRDMGIYQSGVSVGSSLWLVIKIGLFRLSFSQLVIFLLIDGLLLAGSILDRQHKVNQSSGQFRGPGCLYNCPHFITMESEPKSDALTLSVTWVRSKYSPEFTSFHSLLHPSTIGCKFSCIWKAWV